MPELLEIVVKSPVIKSYKNVRQLKEIDLFDESIALPLDKMNLRSSGLMQWIKLSRMRRSLTLLILAWLKD